MKKSIIILFTSIFVITSCSKDDSNVDNTTLPILSTLNITGITSTSAKSGGNITNTGGADITKKGVCWSTTSDPTILDFTTFEGGNPSNYNSNIGGLIVNATYYVRAYATNSKGTGYGNEHTFIAQNVFPGEKVNIAGGTFDMGNDTGYFTQRPKHNITLNSFSISKYEITNAQYTIFMNNLIANIDGSYQGLLYLDMNASHIQIAHNGSSFLVDPGKENFPVVGVTWFGANAYSKYYGGRLPTEAEWEFAALGGNSSNSYTYSGSNTLDDVAWYRDNSNVSHVIGTKNANELGLHDMSGNVYEWINDWSDDYYYSSSPSNNPGGPASGITRIKRGGSFNFNAVYSSVAYRLSNTPSSTYNDLGFRPVFTP